MYYVDVIIIGYSVPTLLKFVLPSKKLLQFRPRQILQTAPHHGVRHEVSHEGERGRGYQDGEVGAADVHEPSVIVATRDGRGGRGEESQSGQSNPHRLQHVGDEAVNPRDHEAEA